MIHLLKKDYGIDTAIEEIQQTLHNDLFDLWQVEFDAYGRVYKNERDGEMIPEVYSTEVKGYKSALYNDRSCFFFIESDDQQGNGFEFTTELQIVFMLNLEQIYKSEKERVDERVFQDVVQILRESFEGVFTIKNHIKGVKGVFKDFGTSKLIGSDLHPLHVFSIKGSLEYFVNCNGTVKSSL